MSAHFCFPTVRLLMTYLETLLGNIGCVLVVEKLFEL